MLIDEVTIHIRAGKGGDGKVAFNNIARSQGPTGGSGGRGGNVIFEGVSDLSALNQFRYKKKLYAEDGENGKHGTNDGTSGEDLIVLVPVGTVIYNLTTGEKEEIVHVSEHFVAAHGGRGGRGNFLFRSSINTTPKESEPGRLGEEYTLKLELKLIAHVGLVGLPNAGKSSLLNELTKAQSKVANYPFTTLEPNLGTYYNLIIADIPGLIEGASSGKGLGTKFLRHIERTKILFHLVSAESDDVVRDYQTIRDELKAHNARLLEKQEYLFVSKSDMVSADAFEKKLKQLKKINTTAVPLSIHDPESLEVVKKLLNEIQKTL